MKETWEEVWERELAVLVAGNRMYERLPGNKVYDLRTLTPL